MLVHFVKLRVSKITKFSAIRYIHPQNDQKLKGYVNIGCYSLENLQKCLKQFPGPRYEN